MPTCRQLLRQEMRLPFSLALVNAGRSIAARIAIMAITTRSSINVKPLANRSRAPSRRRWPVFTMSIALPSLSALLNDFIPDSAPAVQAIWCILGGDVKLTLYTQRHKCLHLPPEGGVP